MRQLVPAEPGDFRGLQRPAFDFFRQLARNNNKGWFHENRAIYEEQVVGPLKALFGALVPVVLRLDPEFEVSGRTGKNFTRINRDIRFSRDKAPYRHNLYLFFSRRDSPGEARLYVGLSADGVTCGCAIYRRPRGVMDRLLKERRNRNREAVEKLFRRWSRRYQMYWHGLERGEWMKYPGPPQSDQDWKRCKALVARKVFPPSRLELRSPRFAQTATKIFQELFPLYAFSALEGPDKEKLLSRARS